MRLMEAVVRGVKELGELGAKLGGRQVRGRGDPSGGRGKTAGRRMWAGAKGR